MIRLEVIERDEEHTYPDITPNQSDDPHILADSYKEKLSEAARLEKEILYFEGIPFVEKKSTNFQNITILEKCIMDFLRQSAFPKKVCIVCENHDISELYKVVYNFYFSPSKEERLDDDKWD